MGSCLEDTQYLHITVEAEGRHEDPLHVAEGSGALLLPVDEEGQSVLIQVQEHADSGPLAHATFCPGKRSPRKPHHQPHPAWDGGDGSESLKECSEYPPRHTAPHWPCRELFFWAMRLFLKRTHQLRITQEGLTPHVCFLTLGEPAYSVLFTLTVPET